MRVLHAVPRRARLAIAVAVLAACSPDRATDPNDSSPVPVGLASRAIAVRVDVAAGTVTVLERSPAAAKSAASLALMGANEISATTSNLFRSAVGQFIAKKVRIRFDVAITNRTSVDLLSPTFPTPPVGTQSVMLFPFSTTLTAGSGAIDQSTDWDGAAINFFNDASCSSGTKSDCYRWEPYPAPFASGTTTAARTVGFDVDPTVQSFTTYFVLAADLAVPGAISGTVTSPQRGPLGDVTVTLTPTNRFTTTDAATGGYAFANVPAGSYTVRLSGLPTYCAPVGLKAITVSSGVTTPVIFSVACPYIAFTSDRDGHPEIYRMNTDGTGQTRLTNGTCFATNPAWSRDGSKLAYQCRVVPSPNPFDPIIDIFVMNADGSNQVNITNGATQNQEPDWGPDGRIVFSSHRDGNDELYAMNADGSNPVRLTSTTDLAEFFPNWSGDGSQITFSRMPYKEEDGQIVPSGNDDIYKMNADGTGDVLLYATAGATDRDPSWQPNGDQIAFWSTNTGCCPSGEGIFLVNANDKTLTQITSPQTGPQMFDPEWSADGTEIVTSGGSSTPANGNDIFVMKADGTGQVDLTNHPGSDTFPAWQP